MNCHSETWAVAPALEPVRESYRTGKSIQWMPLHDLPQFVSFNHSVHVHEGTGCSECHGRVDRMPLTWQERRRQSRFADSGVHRHSFDCLHISGLDDASCRKALAARPPALPESLAARPPALPENVSFHRIGG